MDSGLERKATMTLSDVVTEAHKTAKEKGWWASERPVLMDLPEKVALMHSELSEALEEYRAGRSAEWDGPNGKPEGWAVEFADCIIRICDYCGATGVDIERLVARKLDYNKTRGYRHGGKIA